MKKLIKTIKSKSTNQYYLINVFAFLFLLVILDFFGGALFHKLYQKQKSGWEYCTKYSVEDTKADFIIVGASRAQQQYNPIYFEQRLNQSCYNVGRDGQSFLYEYAVVQAILKRYHPKVILLECERRMFMNSAASYERLACLLPFYKDHPEMRDVLIRKSELERVKLSSQLYPYNSLFFKVITANLSNKPDETIKGYLPLDGSLNEPKRFVDFSENYEIDSVKINYFNSFVKQCQDAGIKLYFTCSPYYFNYTGTDTSLQITKTVAAKNSIPYFDLSKGVSQLNDSKFFDDTVHVNQTGSKILTNIIIDSIMLANK